MTLRSGWLILLALLTGCSGPGSAIFDTLRHTTGSRAGASAPSPTNPNFSYLRVTTDGRVVYLARGSVDPGPHGPVEAWYSATREVIRLQNGRLVGAVGTTAEWRDVVLPPLPSWTALVKSGPYQWLRVRDVMPGYRFGVKDSLVTVAIPPPGTTALQGIDPRSLAWFEERVQPAGSGSSDPAQGFESLPPARYAVSFAAKEEVVYGEQCLAATFCFTWQRWSAEAPTATGK